MKFKNCLPTVTVLLTVKNNVETIDLCLNSLVKQKYPKEKYEILVVDAFSDDGTWEKLIDFKKKIKKPRIILLRKKSNPPTAYNYAIKYIKTDYIAFIDGDCVADKNWLIELVKPFLIEKNVENISGVAGIVLNPRKPENKLQEIIGNELLERYKHFPKKLSRAATMNLLIKTKLVKKVKFDTNLDVVYDTDFGYRLTKKYGKILYQRNAKIYHYHRSSWKKFFKQQFKYANFVPLLYLKHLDKIKGDHVSTPTMGIQIILVYIFLIFASLSIFFDYLLLCALFSIFVLLGIWILSICKLPRKEFKDILYYFGIFVLRLIAWSLGIIIGSLNLIRKKVNISNKNKKQMILCLQ
ncbi:MAG: glycosyltransferase [Candidatus Aenigmatarchaeota archaeon]